MSLCHFPQAENTQRSGFSPLETALVLMSYMLCFHSGANTIPTPRPFLIRKSIEVEDLTPLFPCAMVPLQIRSTHPMKAQNFRIGLSTQTRGCPIQHPKMSPLLQNYFFPILLHMHRKLLFLIFFIFTTQFFPPGDLGFLRVYSTDSFICTRAKPWLLDVRNLESQMEER